MTGFEPATPASRKRCATKLRYIPYDLRHMLAQLGVYLDEFWCSTLVVFSNLSKKSGAKLVRFLSIAQSHVYQQRREKSRNWNS